MSGANDVRRHDDHGWIEVTGARTHNLRDISVRIPRGKLVAFTGVSGSGKTSLAVDTVHAEAQLRYLEGISPFVRRYLGQRDRPEVDRITGLGATLAVDQRRLNNNPRSTMATVTGMDAYLGLVYSPARAPHRRRARDDQLRQVQPEPARCATERAVPCAPTRS